MLYKSLKEKEKDFDCSIISTMDELQGFIEQQKAFKIPNRSISLPNGVTLTAGDFFNRKHYYIYRGIKESKFHLNTSLQFRWNEIKQFHPSYSQKKYLTKMVNLLENNSVIKQYLEKDGKTPTDISILALMQHYGLPTPLLDWTPNIETGLNFAYDGINLASGTDEISEYVSLYFIGLFKNNELEAASYQNIVANSEAFLAESISQMSPNIIEHTDLSNASLSSLFTINDLGLDFIYVDYLEDAPLVQDIFGNVLGITNPNIEKQEGAFIINFHPRGNLDYYWNKKNSSKGIRIISEDKHYCKGLGAFPVTLSDNPNAVGIVPKTKINCANIKKSVLDEWIKKGGQKEHYDNGEESRKLEQATLYTYFSWLLSRKKDYDFFRTQIIKNAETDYQKIAKRFLEDYQNEH